MVSTLFNATARQVVIGTLCGLLLNACGSGSDGAPQQGSSQVNAAGVNDGSTSGVPEPGNPPDFPGITNKVPDVPAVGQSRAGQIYSVYIQSPTGDKVAFTVFEPSELKGGQAYPLILQGHGFGGSRQNSKSAPAPAGLGSDIAGIVNNGYGLISIDQRGHGESTGTVRVMDPDFEGKNLLAILDWAERHLGWIKKDPNGVAMAGSIGGSYGGGYQLLINAIDPRHRLRAMVPTITWYDLRFSLFPNRTPKTIWPLALFGVGNTAGNNLDRGHFDPFVINLFPQDLAADRSSDTTEDFFGYHSNAYFCEGKPIATNGGVGTKPLLPPVHPPRVNAMLFQGMRDTLFNFNEAYNNYQCLKEGGGDVRLLSYQSGHNTLQVVPDPGDLTTQPPAGFLDSKCGPVDVNVATLAFFDEHLKGIAGAADAIPKQPCLSLSKGDAVVVPQVTVDKQGKAFDIPATTVLAGLNDVPVTVGVRYAGRAGGDVVGGIADLDMEVSTPVPSSASGNFDPIIFAGLAIQKSGLPVPDLLDNQVIPIRGYGKHAMRMVGGAERLAAGDKLVLVLYGGHNQYAFTGSLNMAKPSPIPVSVKGTLYAPLLGNLPSLK